MDCGDMGLALWNCGRISVYLTAAFPGGLAFRGRPVSIQRINGFLRIWNSLRSKYGRREGP